MTEPITLDVDVTMVDQVLLADGWHDVEDNSFDVMKFEFMRDGRYLEGAAAEKGATWLELGGIRVACPLTAVLAVEMAAPDEGLASPARPEELARPLIVQHPPKTPRPPGPMPRAR
jgi:hypothetical protein